jgi:hypothetical protein
MGNRWKISQMKKHPEFVPLDASLKNPVAPSYAERI